MTELENIASQLLKSANEADKNYAKTRDQSQRDKATRLRVIVQNLKTLTLGASDLNGLSDVTLTGVTNGQILLYDGATEQWINGSAGGGGDMLKSTYDVDNTGVVDNAEAISIIGRNSTGATLYRGTIVYISGSTGNRPNFAKAQANAEATSAGTFGVVRDDIANNADGFVTTLGYLDNLDTRTVATHPFTDVTLADGDTVYLHPTVAGYITNVKPSAPNHIVYVGKVTRTSPTNGTIVYRIQNGYELDEIHDVAISSKANNDLLTYESASGLWKNKTFSAIFGGTPLVSIPTLDQVTTAGNTTTNAINTGLITTTTSAVGNMFVANGANNTSVRAYNDSSGRAFIEVKGNPSATTTAGAYFTAEGYQEAWFNVVARSAGAGNQYWRFGNIGQGTVNNVFAIQKLNDAATTITFTALAITSSTGNVGIGTTTDAGYKLDVNGTARVQGNSIIKGSDDTNQNFALQITNLSGTTKFQVGNGSQYVRFDQWQPIGGGSSVAWTPGGGISIGVGLNTSNQAYTGITYTGGQSGASTTGTYTSLYLAPTINQTGASGATTRGIHINPTLTSAYDFRAIDVAGGKIVVTSSITAASALAQGVYFNNTLVAAANNDVLVGLDINPTFTNGAFTGVSNIGLRVKGDDVSGGSGYSLYAYGGQAFIKGNWSIDNGYSLIVQNRAGLDSLRVRGDGLTILEKLEVSDGNNKGFTVSYSGVGGYQFGLAVTDAGVAFTNGAAASRPVSFSMNTGEILRIDQNYTSIVTNNFLIGTTTDVGSKLQVKSSITNGTGTEAIRAYGISNYIGMHYDEGRGPVFITNYVGVGGNSPGSFNFYTSAGSVLASIGSGGVYSHNVNGKISAGNANGYINLWNGASGDMELVTTTNHNMTFSTNNTERVRINNSGNVGIGTTTPTAKLQIKGTGDSSVWITTEDFNSGTNTGSAIRIGTRSSNGNTAGWIDAVNNGYSSNGNLMLSAFGGNVLIGTTTDAGYKLDVNGTFRAIGPSTGVYLGNNVDIQNLLTANALYIRSGSNVSAGLYPYSVGTGGIQLQSEPSQPIIRGAFNEDTTIFPVRNDVNNLGDVVIQGGGSERVRFKAAGNVGIGTATPSYPFHIASSAAANVFGTVQSTNANGTAAWVAFNDQSDNVVYRVFGSGASGTQLGVALSRSASLMANLGGSGKFLIGTYSGSDVAFGAGDQERMRIVNSTGNVLIGTTTDAGNKLEVSGTLNAVDFKVGGVPGWSGIINIPTMPPITITVNSGIITNVM